MDILFRLTCFEALVAAECLDAMADNEHAKGADEGHAAVQLGHAVQFFHETADELASQAGFDVPAVKPIHPSDFALMLAAVQNHAEAAAGPSTTRHDGKPSEADFARFQARANALNDGDTAVLVEG